MRRKENTASHHQTDTTSAKKGRSRRHRTNYWLDSRIKLELCRSSMTQRRGDVRYNVVGNHHQADKTCKRNQPRGLSRHVTPSCSGDAVGGRGGSLFVNPKRASGPIPPKQNFRRFRNSAKHLLDFSRKNALFQVCRLN